MTRQIKVYITAKREHAEKIRAIKQDGIHITSRWIWTAGRGDIPVTHWLVENFIDAINSDYVVLYAEAGDNLNGSLLEIGHAIGYQKRILIAGERDFEAGFGLPNKALQKWVGFDNVRVCGTLEQTLIFIKREIMQRELITKAGEIHAGSNKDKSTG